MHHHQGVSTTMRMGSKQGGIGAQLFALVILVHVSHGRAAMEERFLRSTGIVFLQVSASPEPIVTSAEGNASALRLHVSGSDLASPPKAMQQRHRRERHAGQQMASRRTVWRRFLGIQTATNSGVDGETIGFGCVAIVVAILCIVVAIETAQYDNYSLKGLAPTRRERYQYPTADINSPLRQAAVAPPPEARTAHPPLSLRQAASSKEETATGHPWSLRQARPPEERGSPTTAAHTPRPSTTGNLLQEEAMRRGGSFDMQSENVAKPLPQAQTESRSGTISDIQLFHHAQDGRLSVPHSLERLPMASAGETPVGSASRLQGSLQGGATPGGVLGGPSQVLSSGSISSEGPPPVCKELVLHTREAWFAVALDDLVSTRNTDFDLYGLSGRPLLRASIRKTASLHKLSLSMQSLTTLGAIGSIQLVNSANDSTRKKMQIRAKNDEYYADLIDTGDMRYVVTRTGTGTGPSELLTVHVDNAQNHLWLTSSTDGSLLAQASRCTTSEFIEQFHDKGHFEVRVNPGVDALLALLCVMAVVHFTVHEF